MYIEGVFLFYRVNDGASNVLTYLFSSNNDSVVSLYIVFCITVAHGVTVCIISVSKCTFLLTCLNYEVISIIG